MCVHARTRVCCRPLLMGRALFCGGCSDRHRDNAKCMNFQWGVHFLFNALQCCLKSIINVVRLYFLDFG